MVRRKRNLRLPEEAKHGSDAQSLCELRDEARKPERGGNWPAFGFGNSGAGKYRFGRGVEDFGKDVEGLVFQPGIGVEQEDIARWNLPRSQRLQNQIVAATEPVIRLFGIEGDPIPPVLSPRSGR